MVSRESSAYNSRFVAAIRPWFPMPFRLSVLLASSLLVLVACAPPVPEDPEPVAMVDAPEAPERVEDAATRLQTVPESEQPPLAIRWAEDYLGRGQLAEAEQLLSMVRPDAIDGNLRLEWVLASARVRLAQQDTRGALRLLSSDVLEVPALLEEAPEGLRNQLLLLRADSLALAGRTVESLRERVALDPGLDEDRQQYNRQTTWTLLMQAPRQVLRELEETSEDELLGWVELAMLYRDPLADIDSQVHQLEQWQQRWEDHPAEEDQPAMVRALHEAIRERPEHIAVLLPLEGSMQPAGEAIRDGMLTAYFSALEQGHPVPVIRFHDTADRPIVEVYNEALVEGADFVLGPLDRESGETLAAVDKLPVTTLALNYVRDQSVTDNFHQFGLSPEDEARQVASQAHTEGARLAGVLHPRSEWGRRVARAFEHHWEELDATVTTRASFGENHGAAVSELLNINRSEARARAIRRYTGELEFEPRRRQDLDFLFLLANPSQARQVKPALNFHYAADLQVFSISNVYAGRPDPSRDGDLDGIRFVDIPWLLDRDSTLHDAAQQAWPAGHGPYTRLFALGVDAYRLAPRLTLLRSVPDSNMPGATGQLQLKENNRIERELDWAWFTRGQPQRMPMVAPDREGAGSNGNIRTRRD